MKMLLLVFFGLLCYTNCFQELELMEKQLVIIDQDCSGPASTNTNSIIALLQSSSVKVLGITISSGDGWLAEEVLHCQRMIELLDLNVPVYKGASMPFDQSPISISQWEQSYGKMGWKGGFGLNYTALEVFTTNFPEGLPQKKNDNDLSAAEFIATTLLKYPPQTVTILALAPLTNIATAIMINPDLPKLVKSIYIGGGALNCNEYHEGTEGDFMHCDMPNRAKNEFNLFFDPIAARRVLMAEDKVIPQWTKLIVVPVDITSRAMWNEKLQSNILNSGTKSLAAKYIVDYLIKPQSIQKDFPMFDEVVALSFLYPQIITSSTEYYLDVDTSMLGSRGDMEYWEVGQNKQPLNPSLQIARVFLKLNLDLFYELFEELMVS